MPDLVRQGVTPSEFDEGCLGEICSTYLEQFSLEHGLALPTVIIGSALLSVYHQMRINLVRIAPPNMISYG